jgi:hypothetical protein
MSRSAAGPEEFFGGKYPEFLQSDGYSVYKSLERQGKTVYVGCWAHARRKYYDARAEDPTFTNIVISAVQKLFRIEREAKSEGVVGESLVELRRERSLPILESIKNLAESKRHEVVPESGLGKAIDYMLGNWEGLTRYIEIPEAPLSNNSAERSLRGVVVGRKNWLFIGHPNAGPRAATILSLIETCRRLGIEPYKYLKSVITELAADPGRASELTPRAWLERERAAAENPRDRAGR